jgi:hypothetical protein
MSTLKSSSSGHSILASPYASASSLPHVTPHGLHEPQGVLQIGCRTCGREFASLTDFYTRHDPACACPAVQTWRTSTAS